MGDAPDAGIYSSANPPNDRSRQKQPQPAGLGTMTAEPPDSGQGADPRTAENAPFYSQYPSISPAAQQRPETLRIPSYQGEVYQSSASEREGPSPLQMGAMGTALPDYGTAPAQHPQQPFTAGMPGQPAPAFAYQMQQAGQYGGQASSPYSFHNPYPAGFPQGQYGPAQGYRAPYGAQRSAGPSPTAQSFPSGPQSNPQYMYYTSNYGGYQQPTAFAGLPAQGLGQPGRRTSMPYGQAPGQLQPGLPQAMPGAGYGPGGQGFPMAAMGGQFPTRSYGGLSRQSSESNLASTISRGPPRKPKQSGHALWVGNLPPGTTIIDLKDHFSRDATSDIESLFLISKSNCAFVNYKTEESCTAAMHRFHDSRFQGVRLVCRLRRSSAPASGVPTAPSAMTGAQAPIPAQPSPERVEEQEESLTEEEPSASGADQPPEATSQAKVPEKFFVVKSLTVQDLETSVINGIWATQSHNETVLNKAYETAENVYLIFSANKSGEYFGYARMASPISDDISEFAQSLPQTKTAEAVSNAPKAIPTVATDTAPKGRIIDDSARGTIFWEAERSDSETESPSEPEARQPLSPSGASQEWGKPFRVEWICVSHVPFYKTRGLRNPWNANREVKIARDGTELETSVGKRLVHMFHRSNIQTVPTSAPPGAVLPSGAPIAPGMMNAPPPIVGMPGQEGPMGPH